MTSLNRWKRWSQNGRCLLLDCYRFRSALPVFAVAWSSECLLLNPNLAFSSERHDRGSRNWRSLERMRQLSCQIFALEYFCSTAPDGSANR